MSAAVTLVRVSADVLALAQGDLELGHDVPVGGGGELVVPEPLARLVGRPGAAPPDPAQERGAAPAELFVVYGPLASKAFTSSAFPEVILNWLLVIIACVVVPL